MKPCRDKIERQKRKVEDLIVHLFTQAKLNDQHPNFHKCDAQRKAAEFCQKAASELYMATVALMEVTPKLM